MSVTALSAILVMRHRAAFVRHRICFVDSSTDTEVWTHEFRVVTPAEHSVRATGGVFFSELVLKELNDFTYPGSVAAATVWRMGAKLCV